MVGEVCSAVDAAVGAVAAGQVRLERFGARHGDHGPGRRAVQEGAAGPGRLTREAPQHTGEGRGGAGWEVYTCTHTGMSWVNQCREFLQGYIIIAQM